MISPLKCIQKAKMMSEMGSVSQNYVENMYHNSIYDKKSLCYGRPCFPIWPTAAILNF